MPSCTIVIPTHNRDDLLVRSVRSALQACPADGEVLVVDDKSIIPAAQVLDTESDPRLRVIVNTGPSGASNARNLGVSSACGDVEPRCCPRSATKAETLFVHDAQEWC